MASATNDLTLVTELITVGVELADACVIFAYIVALATVAKEGLPLTPFWTLCRSWL